jgi:hypothetical protein
VAAFREDQLGSSCHTATLDKVLNCSVPDFLFSFSFSFSIFLGRVSLWSPGWHQMHSPSYLSRLSAGITGLSHHPQPLNFLLKW